ncbi:hypothetical protein G647_08595 [Cladophialophora carrionii CBS 160.54]|uniref:Uncharacterized protein n=1 Tax=Cladophialophora carrionii CBS 160.54 TaxID=1279043 RepID=V9D2P1_9EURO|nr:uncharacterized protein G647_08595 [Cladophialophora carrionii CBS 160.54]ETI20558.1 hypothetical protein G647_08595 [Cladophialophora carrionii CBS 160.54]
MPLYEITGNTQSRFVQAAALLHLLDPVRGEPSAYGLDQDSNTLEQNRERLLKRKFLDSFALICAKKKDGDTVSAACLEEGRPEGTIVRIASNQGVAQSTLAELRELVAVLNGVAAREYAASDKAAEVLQRITSLDAVRIRSYLKDIRSVGDDVRDIVDVSSSAPAFLQLDNAGSFPEWIAHVFTIRDLPLEPASESLVDHVQWALEARRTYLACLKALFPDTLPRWVYAILKLGRYAIASMALLHFASDFPALFNPMLVEPAIAPPRTQFTGMEEMPLTSVLRRIASGPEVTHYISRLAQVWQVQDPEAHFRNVCTLNLPVHAEMQLLNFYDHNPKRKPSFRFIGVSKKSCFLCHWFLTRHPQSFNIAACHQKLYLTWRPPPAADAVIYRRYKAIVTDLAKAMELTAKQELQNRLGLRRPVPPDSTAGVSVSGLMDLNNRSHDAPAISEMVTTSAKSVVREVAPTTSSLRPIPVVDTSSRDEELSWRPWNNSSVGDSCSTTEMMFHVMRLNETQRQDIIALRDVMDRHSGEPSWAKLVDLLMDEAGVGLRDGDFLMVNDRIRVGNERQLLACLQFLRNEKVLNSEVYVYNLSTRSPGVTQQG